MSRIISVVGYGGSGKTTYLEKLIAVLTARGLRVTVIKHTSHPEAFLGSDGKDTDRHFSAGASGVALVGPSGYSLAVRGPEPAVEEVLGHMGPADLVITEGYKSGPWPKVEIRRQASGQPALFKPEELLALVTDGEETGRNVFSLDQPEALAVWLLNWLESDHGTDG